MSNFNELVIGKKWNNETILGFFNSGGFLTISEHGNYSVWTQPCAPDEVFGSIARAAFLLKDCQRDPAAVWNVAQNQKFTTEDMKNLV